MLYTVHVQEMCRVQEHAQYYMNGKQKRRSNRVLVLERLPTARRKHEGVRDRRLYMAHIRWKKCKKQNTSIQK